MADPDVSSPQGAAGAPEPRSHGKSTKRCNCGLALCQQWIHGEIDRGGEGYPFGRVRLPKGHPTELERWLKDLGFLNIPGWSSDKLKRCAQNPGDAEFKSLVLGKWHFRKEMFSAAGRLDWKNAVTPSPCVSMAEADVLLHPPARDLPCARSLKRAMDELDGIAMHGDLLSPVTGHLRNLKQAKDGLGEELAELRGRLAELDGLQRGAEKLVAEQKQALLKAEQEMLQSEASNEELETVIAQLNAAPKAWLSHRNLQTDKNLSDNIKEFGFFPTVEAHNAFFNLINTKGAAENLVLYSAQGEPTIRKLQQRSRPRARRVLAQD
jgi:hypothetical protein